MAATAVFTFTKDKVTDAFEADVRAVNGLNDELFGEFALLVFGILTHNDKPAARLLEQIDEFGTRAGNAAVMTATVRAWLTFFRGCQKHNATPQLVFADLLALRVDEAKAKLMGKGFKSNQVAMSRSVVGIAWGRTLAVNQLVDMVWRFGVSAGSSEFRQTGSTFLQLKVTVNKGQGPEDVWMELTLPQFYAFLHEMEKAKATLDAVA